MNFVLHFADFQIVQKLIVELFFLLEVLFFGVILMLAVPGSKTRSELLG